MAPTLPRDYVRVQADKKADIQKLVPKQPGPNGEYWLVEYHDGLGDIVGIGSAPFVFRAFWQWMPHICYVAFRADCREAYQHAESQDPPIWGAHDDYRGFLRRGILRLPNAFGRKGQLLLPVLDDMCDNGAPEPADPALRDLYRSAIEHVRKILQDTVRRTTKRPKDPKALNGRLPDPRSCLTPAEMRLRRDVSVTTDLMPSNHESLQYRFPPGDVRWRRTHPEHVIVIRNDWARFPAELDDPGEPPEILAGHSPVAPPDPPHPLTPKPDPPVRESGTTTVAPPIEPGTQTGATTAETEHEPRCGCDRDRDRPAPPSTHRRGSRCGEDESASDTRDAVNPRPKKKRRITTGPAATPKSKRVTVVVVRPSDGHDDERGYDRWTWAEPPHTVVRLRANFFDWRAFMTSLEAASPRKADEHWRSVYGAEGTLAAGVTPPTEDIAQIWSEASFAKFRARNPHSRRFLAVLANAADEAGNNGELLQADWLRRLGEDTSSTGSTRYELKQIATEFESWYPDVNIRDVDMLRVHMQRGLRGKGALGSFRTNWTQWEDLRRLAYSVPHAEGGVVGDYISFPTEPCWLPGKPPLEVMFRYKRLWYETGSKTRFCKELRQTGRTEGERASDHASGWQASWAHVVAYVTERVNRAEILDILQRQPRRSHKKTGPDAGE
ncbi:hypothetical protein EDC01DRAFT_765661 [Geopyxis carbonaria]|nr:hypothetical protein EDC01DRAFT_765661 [Geopyxis carbonaria]